MLFRNVLYDNLLISAYNHCWPYLPQLRLYVAPIPQYPPDGRRNLPLHPLHQLAIGVDDLLIALDLGDDFLLHFQGREGIWKSVT